MISQVIERCVFDRAGVAWKHQQPRLPTLGRRVLRDQLPRQPIVILVEVGHGIFELGIERVFVEYREQPAAA